MIKAEHLSFEYPDKELYQDISFTIEDQSHCAFIGTNGTGKSTLIQMLLDTKDFIYDGKLEIPEHIRIGYVSQFSQMDTRSEMTVFEYMSAPFQAVQDDITQICEQMGTADDMETLMEQYQQKLDLFAAMDGDQYETKIRKQLKLAELGQYEDVKISNLSSGEYKLVQIMTQMLALPQLLIMDEPDGFLDFAHQNALKDLINEYEQTLLVITHNRYLLNHCFDQILHLENHQMQEFDGNYIEYNYALLQKKIEQQELAAADTAEIERQQKILDKLRKEALVIDKPSKGRALHARQTLVDRLQKNRIQEPFLEIRQPEISLDVRAQKLSDEEQTDDLTLQTGTDQEVVDNIDQEHQIEQEEDMILKVQDYEVGFEEVLLEHVSFEIGAKDKVAVIGANGVGKTTLLRDIYKNEHAAIHVKDDIQMAFLSQQQGETMDEAISIADTFYDLGLTTNEQCRQYLQSYGLEDISMDRTVGELSGGEKNLLQLAKLAFRQADLLLLDEPTSHLDIYSQLALEQAIKEYQGAILMVSHDFYTVADCMDYVLYIDEKSIRKVSARKFRKMIYARHFPADYLQNEQKKKELELKITRALKEKDYKQADEVSVELGKIIEQM